MRPMRLLATMLMALPALAQAGDLSVVFNAAYPIPAPSNYTYLVAMRWTGAEPARDIVLDLELPGAVRSVASRGPEVRCTFTAPVRCTMPLLHANEPFAGVVVTVALPETAPATHVARAMVTTSTPGEGPESNNTASHTLAVSAMADLMGSVGFDETTIDPGDEGTVRVHARNGGVPARNAILRVTIDEGTILGVTIVNGPYDTPSPLCAVEDNEAVCRWDELLRHSMFTQIEVRYRAPARRSGGVVVARATMSSDVEEFNPANDTFTREMPLRRVFAVTSDADAGPGTLRQAILDARAPCAESPCTIVFEGVATIRPLAPLPELAGRLRVTGRGTYVELDGEQLAAGDGLLYTSGCLLELRHLVVRNFPGHGVEARPAERCGDAQDQGLYVSHSYFSGNTRGIVVKNTDALLTWNVVHENHRAGIFLDGSYYVIVRNNVVVNNGAAGIFVNTTPELLRAGVRGGGEVVQNVVHGNGEWGIARTRTGLVEVRENSLARNALYGFDVGLDLSSVDPAMPKPQLHSAHYDPSRNETVIRGIAPAGGKLDFYATPELTAYPQAEHYLGWRWSVGVGAAEVRIAGDWRGHWITATATQHVGLYFLRSDVWRPPTGIDTSELSDAVRVE